MRKETTSKIRVMRGERKKGEAKNLNQDSLLPGGALVAKPVLGQVGCAGLPSAYSRLPRRAGSLVLEGLLYFKKTHKSSDKSRR